MKVRDYLCTFYINKIRHEIRVVYLKKGYIITVLSENGITTLEEKQNQAKQ